MPKDVPVMAGERTQTFTYAEKDGIMTITAKDGSGSRSFNPADIHADVLPKALLFATKQVLSTRSAQAKTVPEKFKAMDNAWKAITAGVWSENRSGASADGLSATHGYFVAAAHKVTSQPVEKLTGALLAMDPEARAKYVKDKSAHPKIKAILDAMAADRAREKAKETAKLAKGDGDEAFSLGDLTLAD